MITFHSWLEAKRISVKRNPQWEGGTIGTHFDLNVGRQNIGGMNIGPIGGDDIVARRMFPGIIKDNERVARIHEISIEDDWHGFGLGQLLYLQMFDKGGADWYYNSQTWPPATNTLKSLAAKGYIEIYWRREPEWNQEGGVHLVRITPAGRDAYRKRGMVRRQELEGR